jgi:hypothetical protein
VQHIYCEGIGLKTVQYICEADVERVEAIRRWYIDQVIGAKNTPIALLNVTINSDGEICTNRLCIEPKHAQVLLPELHRLIWLLENQGSKVIAA